LTIYGVPHMVVTMKCTPNKEELEHVIPECRSFHDVLIRLGKNQSAAAYRTLKKYVNEFGIDISHFRTPSENARRSFRNDILLIHSENEIFAPNSKFSRSTIRAIILRKNLLPYACQICENKGVWLDKKITLILDHKNGVPNDHRLENLRFLCPNCNATLPTHCVGHKRLEIQSKSVRIDGRTLKKGIPKIYLRKVKERPSYETLIEQITQTNAQATGRKYGVSGTTIRKWVKRYEEGIS